MITKVNNIDLKVLSLFTKGYERSYYIREVEKLLNISSRTALIRLAKLEKKAILESESKGKIKNYSIKKSIISREYFILAEQYKKIHFLEKNLLIKEVLEKTEEFIQGMVIIFGSFSKAIQKEDSDLDLFIIGEYNEDKIKEVGNMYGININIKSYPIEIFEKELHDDILLKEILDNHILIKDTEGFVRRVINWIK